MIVGIHKEMTSFLKYSEGVQMDHKMPQKTHSIINDIHLYTESTVRVEVNKYGLNHLSGRYFSTLALSEAKTASDLSQCNIRGIRFFNLPLRSYVNLEILHIAYSLRYSLHDFFSYIHKIKRFLHHGTSIKCMQEARYFEMPSILIC